MQERESSFSRKSFEGRVERGSSGGAGFPTITQGQYRLVQTIFEGRYYDMGRHVETTLFELAVRLGGSRSPHVKIDCVSLYPLQMIGSGAFHIDFAGVIQDIQEGKILVED